MAPRSPAKAQPSAALAAPSTSAETLRPVSQPFPVEDLSSSLGPQQVTTFSCPSRAMHTPAAFQSDRAARVALDGQCRSQCPYHACLSWPGIRKSDRWMFTSRNSPHNTRKLVHVLLLLLQGLHWGELEASLKQELGALVKTPGQQQALDDEISKFKQAHPHLQVGGTGADAASTSSSALSSTSLQGEDAQKLKSQLLRLITTGSPT